MNTPGGTGKRIIASVTSGLCNRLWVLACSLRLAEQSGRRVKLLWLNRTGRVGLPYEGNESSTMEDYLLPDVEGLESVVQIAVPPDLPEGAVGLDYRDVHELTLALQAGRPPQISAGLAAKATGPRILDLNDAEVAAADDVWINLSTMPVGGPDDGMERYVSYPDRLGLNARDAFLESLSPYARRMRPRPAEQAAVDELVSRMRGAPGGARLVGVHVRATDLKQRSSVDRNVRLADMVHRLTCAPGQGARVFLASDSPAWLEEFTGSVLRPQARAAVTTYENPEKFGNSVAGARAALVDLYTLAACDSICGTAGSSFSSFAWLLSDAEFWIHS
ncbi:MAG: hypothetical protein ACE5G3_12445 [Gammaproteobacteria bacterium]